MRKQEQVPTQGREPGSASLPEQVPESTRVPVLARDARAFRGACRVHAAGAVLVPFSLSWEDAPHEICPEGSDDIVHSIWQTVSE